MSDRDDDFRRLVPMLLGWTISEPDGNLVKSLRAFRRTDYASFGFPAPDAPLPERMAFVGRLCAELPDMDLSERLTWCAGVLADAADIPPGDVAWIAVRAAIAAKGGAT